MFLMLHCGRIAVMLMLMLIHPSVHITIYSPIIIVQ